MGSWPAWIPVATAPRYRARLTATVPYWGHSFLSRVNADMIFGMYFITASFCS